MINIDTPINFACERQAKWIASVELGRAVLPTPNEMLDAIDQKQRWVRQKYGSATRHSLQEESVIYYRELKKTLREAARRRPSNIGGMTETTFTPPPETRSVSKRV
jgi:hypothetical protein